MNRRANGTKGAMRTGREKGLLPDTATRSRPRGAAPFSCRQRLRARGLLGCPPGHDAAALTTSACHLHGTRVRTGASAWAGHQSRMAVGARARQRPTKTCACITGERYHSRHQKPVRLGTCTVGGEPLREAGRARATWQINRSLELHAQLGSRTHASSVRARSISRPDCAKRRSSLRVELNARAG